jgi:hypothetical protein
MGYVNRLIAVLVAFHGIAASAVAGERASSHGDRALSGKLTHLGRPTAKYVGLTVAPIDRVASAVDGAESSHGQDMAMWRPDPVGPQGPMQVTEAAATDVGGGDRFDMLQNRAIGRAYLAQLFSRYGNWPDAIAAYNWGIGKMDAWLRAGRPPDKLLVGVATYLRRVLRESGLCNDGAETAPHWQRGDPAREPGESSPGSSINAACSGPDAWAGSTGSGTAPSRFSRKLDQALQLALQRAAQAR